MAHCCFYLGDCMAKDYAVAFYNSARWHKCRAAYLSSKQRLCENCLARGIIQAADTVHHVINITPENINDDAITLNWKNLKAVCRDCHAKEHGDRVNIGYAFNADGTIKQKGNRHEL